MSDPAMADTDMPRYPCALTLTTHAMTRIDFYTLEPDSPGDRLLLVCRLCERIRSEGLRILVHCPDAGIARQLDRLLWTFRDDAFLPHGILGVDTATIDPVLTPILISPDGQPEVEDQALINLGPEVPTFFSRFQRVCEPIDQEPGVRASGRERFRWYRERGYPLEHHEIRLSAC
jgi:DNA polymerase-3 subunit chi